MASQGVRRLLAGTTSLAARFEKQIDKLNCSSSFLRNKIVFFEKFNSFIQVCRQAKASDPLFPAEEVLN